MSRTTTALTLMVTSMIAGGMLFGHRFGYAASGEPETGVWPSSAPVVVAQADPPRPRAPRPPTPPQPPQLPFAGSIRDLVRGQIAAARAEIASNPQIPKDLKTSILARLDKVAAAVDKRLANVNLSDLDKLEEEMEKMGEEIEKAMEGLDKDLEKLGDKLSKDLSKDLGKWQFRFDDDHHDDHDDDDDDDLPSTPDVADADDRDMREAISDLQDLALKPQQKHLITKLRDDSDKQVATAKKQLDELSAKLQGALAQPGVTDADITRLVDQISAQEAQIRKVRIVAWAQARRVLDAAQRKRVEDAAAKTKVKVKVKVK